MSEITFYITYSTLSVAGIDFPKDSAEGQSKIPSSFGQIGGILIIVYCIVSIRSTCRQYSKKSTKENQFCDPYNL